MSDIVPRPVDGPPNEPEDLRLLRKNLGIAHQKAIREDELVEALADQGFSYELIQRWIDLDPGTRILPPRNGRVREAYRTISNYIKMHKILRQGRLRLPTVVP